MLSLIYMLLSKDVTYVSNVFETYINVIIWKLSYFHQSILKPQTCTINCELIVILFPLQLCVCDVYLLNHAILVVMLIYRGPA